VNTPEGTRDIRVGNRERESAQAALAEHLAAGRLELDEYAQRVDRCLAARTRRELLVLFDDLPQPRPDVSASPAGEIVPDDAKPLPATAAGNARVAATGAWDVPLGLTILLGFPVAVVLGFAYGAWWTLAVPAAVTVLLGAASLRGRR